MTATTATELQELLRELEKEPTNLDLINQIAIGYIENPSVQAEDEELKYFELAYSTRKTVKSAHNLAWYLYFEWGEQDRAIRIQKECTELNPKSYYPYYQYGYMLLEQRRFEEAIPFLEKAWQIEEWRDIIHNMGYCYFQMEQFQTAKEYFSKSVTDLDKENRSLYNLALTEWKLNNNEEVERIALQLSKDIETNVQGRISGYEIGLLYFLLDDFQRASECLIKQGIDGIDLMDWTDLSYSLFKTDYKLWRKTIIDRIVEQKKFCDEIESNHEDWNDYTDEEKKERLYELTSEIKSRQEILDKVMSKPLQDLNKSVLVEYCGCLLFDCKRHGNRKND